MSSITNDEYTYRLTLRNGNMYDITEAVTSATRSDNANDVAQSLDLQLTVPANPDKRAALGAKELCGARIDSFINGTERRTFTGIIWQPDTQTEPTDTATIQAFDPLIFLMRSKDNRYFKKGTSCRTAITGLLDELLVPYIYAGPDFSIDGAKFSNNAYAEMILSFLKEGEDKHGTGKFYFRYMPDNGRAVIMARGSNGQAPKLDMNNRGPLTHRATYPEITRIKIIGQDKQNSTAAAKAILDGDLTYGIIQEVQSVSGTTLAKARSKAQTDLDTRGKVKEQITLPSADAPGLRRGDFVYLEDSRAALTGLWPVIAVSHDQKAGTMSVTVEGI